MTSVATPTAEAEFAVPNGGTLELSYPAGFVSTQFSGSAAAVVVVINNNEFYRSSASEVSFEYESLAVVLTNTSGVTWAAGSEVYAMLQRTDLGAGSTPVVTAATSLASMSEFLAQTASWDAGSVVVTRAERFAFEAAEASATDHHLTDNGGQKWYALPDAEGRVCITQLGVAADDDIGDLLRAFGTTRLTGIRAIVQDVDVAFSGATVTLPANVRYVSDDYTSLSHGQATTRALALRDREAVVASLEGLATEANAVFSLPAFGLIGGIRFDHSQDVDPLEMRNGGSFNVISGVQGVVGPRVDRCAFVQEGGVCMSLNGNQYWRATDVYYDTARTGLGLDEGCDHGLMQGCRGSIGLETLRASGSLTQKFGDWIKTNRGTVNGPAYCAVLDNHMVNPVRDCIDYTGGFKGWRIERNTFDCDIAGLDIKQSYDAANSENERERYFEGAIIRGNTYIGCGNVWTLSWVDANLGFAYDERLGIRGNICDGNIYWPKHGKNVAAHSVKGVGRIVSTNESLRSIFGNKLGDWDASTGSFPSGSTAQNYYEVTTGGTVDGETFTTGDIVYALVDDASTTNYAGNWVNNGSSVHSGVSLLDLDDNAVFPQEASEVCTFDNLAWDTRGANSTALMIPRSRFDFADLVVADSSSVRVEAADVTLTGFATKLAGTATNPLFNMTSDASNLTIDMDATHEGTTARLPFIQIGNQTLDRLSVSGRVRGFDELINVNSNATLSSLHLGAIRPLVLSGVDGILVSNGTPDVTEVQVGAVDHGTAAATLGVPSGDGPTVVSGAVFPQKRGPGAELTIASGVVAVTHQSHTIDTEADAASDDLDTINGGAVGDTLTISAADGTRTVVAKDGTGNLTLGGDRSLDEAGDTLVLRKYADGNWHQVDFFTVTP